MYIALFKEGMKSNPSHNFNLPIIIITIVTVVFRTYTLILSFFHIDVLCYYIITLQATQAAASNDILELEQKIAELQLRVCILTNTLYILCLFALSTHMPSSHDVYPY